MTEYALGNIEPAEVFRYFEEINKIPRGSGNEKAVSDYLVGFAKAHSLNVVQDKALNVVIKKPGTAGYEHSPVVVLQGHMDMVCEKEPDSSHDFLLDPIQMRVVGDMLFASGTTLGADNGIAIAMGLALLASDNIPHPPLELLVTTNEETGMDGARELDPNHISGSTLINIDSEEEGVLTVSCAGGCTARINIPVAWEKPDPALLFFEIAVNGLTGGHSGIEIHTGRANANKLLARILADLNAKMNIALCLVEGGSKHNAIARDARAVIGVNKQDESLLKECAKGWGKTFGEEYAAADPGICVDAGALETEPKMAMSKAGADQVIRLLYLIPNGVQSMSMNIKGLVESSLNLGVVQTKEQSVEIISTLRSSVASIKENMFTTVKTLADMSNGAVVREGEYPEWRYNPTSRVRDILAAYYKELFGEELKMDAIHAGLECAIFDKKFEEKMDMVSIGPTIIGAHTTQEHLSIPSTQRTWAFLQAALKALK